MKGFACDEKGDLVTQNGDIELVEGTDLLMQKARALLASGKGEWFLNEEEGVSREVLLGKNPEEARVRDEIRRALLVLDDALELAEFDIVRLGRELQVRFTAEKTNKKTGGV